MNRESRGAGLFGEADQDDHFLRMKSNEPRLSMVEESDKLDFIRKVYGILLTQLTITSVATLVTFMSPTIKYFILHNPSLVMILAFAGFIISCCLFCVQSLARQVPTNYVLMFAFTFCQAYTVAYICTAVNSPTIVIMAAFMTAGVVMSLTFYSFYTDHDFTVYGGMLFVVMAIFLMIGLLSAFFGPTMRLIYCGLGVLLFGFYLIMDTQMLIGGGKYELNRDDYILGAIILYMDIINIFLYILQILSSLFGSKE